MMQNIAAATSDIAGFASELKMTLEQKLESNDNFGQYMQGQAAKNLRHENGKKQPVEQTFSDKNNISHNPQDNLQAKGSKNTDINDADLGPKDEASLAVTSKQAKANRKELSETENIEKQPLSHNTNQGELSAGKISENTTHEAADLNLEKERNNALDLKSEVNNSLAGLQLVLPENAGEKELKVDLSTEQSDLSETEAQNWIALIESYQKLADINRGSEKQANQELTSLVDLSLSLPSDKNVLKKDAEGSLVYQQGGESELELLTKVERHIVDSEIVKIDEHNFLTKAEYQLLESESNIASEALLVKMVAQYPEASATFNSGESESLTKIAQYLEGLATVNPSESESLKKIAQYLEGLATVNPSEPEPLTKIAQYLEGLATVNPSEPEPLKKIAQYLEGLATVNPGESESLTKIAQYLDATAAVNTNKIEFVTKNKQNIIKPEKLAANQTEILTNNELNTLDSNAVKAPSIESINTTKNSWISEAVLKSKTEKAIAKVTELVQQSLDDLTLLKDINQSSESNSLAIIADEILAEPKLMQGIQTQLAKLSQQTSSATTELKKLVDANAELLATLLANNKTAKADLGDSIGMKSSSHAVLNESQIASQTIKSAKKSGSTSVKTETIQPELSKVNLDASQWLFDDLQVESEASQLVQSLAEPISNKAESGSSNTNRDLKLLSTLPEKKLTKVLEQIAERIMPNTATSEATALEQKANELTQQLVIPKAADIKVLTDSPVKDFVAALKSGIEEFKSQLAQGREPGLDLKALIADAMTKSAEVAIQKPAANLDQITQSISQVLDFAQSIGRVIENHQEQVYTAMHKDVAQLQAESSKSVQLNQFESKFEKAININKPEGHQQLAEKVRWMVNTKNLVAEIRLDPAELGSVNVKVAMSGETATVNFVVQSQQARDAMDTATPRLREMLAEKGIELGQSSVEQESNEQNEQQDGELAKHNPQQLEQDAELDMLDPGVKQQAIVNGALGGIDYFV